MSTSSIPGFRTVPRTGVIYVTTRAQSCGFGTDPAWANLGQGAPEPNPLGEQLLMETALEDVSEYAPVVGLYELRQAVANLYNALYRQGKSSQYTAENVAICSGGRLALTRIAASLGDVNVGHVIPDYTAYEELLTIFKAFTPIPILLSEESCYRLPCDQLEKEIHGRGLSALLLSNPCNPTGQHIRGSDLQCWVETSRSCDCTLIVDEFYSHYVYDNEETAIPTVSAASFVDDVDRDPVVIVDGLTKNWRLPGWRISWTVGPRSVIESLASAGSFLDGGAPHPLQAIAAKRLLDPERVIRQARDLQRDFGMKRDDVIQRLETMGLRVPHIPQGAFYCWTSLANLPHALQDGMAFFEAGLREKVITVPGEFFDVNPGKRRRDSRFREYVRISFGPSMQTLKRGMDALERIVLQSR